MIIRRMGWEEWEVENPKEFIESLRDRVSQGDMRLQLLILDACVFTYPDISSYLYESIAHHRSYDQMPYIALAKNDFYAYRRKAVAIVYRKLVYNNKED